MTYRLYTLDEGGRRTPAFQGIRWDFMYDEHQGSLCIIYPEITDLTLQTPFPAETAIPEYGMATMWIVNTSSRPFHQQWIQVGTRGYFMEGNRKIAVCEVTRIIGLFSNPVA
ncbi:MAG: hypothetical protein LH609_01770 [Rudanella sp.]|nr:hypothetical protein [Rudanella sp.]